jgi:hypothetical protein
VTKDEAVAQMFASRAKALENESDAQRAALIDALESILSITREEHFIRGADSKLYEVGTIARIAIIRAGGEA